MAVDLRRVATIHGALLLLVAGAAYATHWAEAGSVLLGGAVMAANLGLLSWIAGALAPSPGAEPGRGKTALAIAALVLKFGLFLGLLALLFWRLPIDVVGFAAGVTVLLVACVVAALFGSGAKGES